MIKKEKCGNYGGLSTMLREQSSRSSHFSHREIIAQGFDGLSSNFHDHGLIEQCLVGSMIMNTTDGRSNACAMISRCAKRDMREQSSRGIVERPQISLKFCTRVYMTKMRNFENF